MMGSGRSPAGTGSVLAAGQRCPLRGAALGVGPPVKFLHFSSYFRFGFDFGRVFSFPTWELGRLLTSLWWEARPLQGVSLFINGQNV